MSRRRTAFLLGALWPGLGQLAAARPRAGTVLCMAALGLADVVLTGWLVPGSVLARAVGPALLGWGLLWAAGMGDLAAALVVGPSRRERSDRLLRAGVAYLLRDDLARAAEALDRAVTLGAPPSASLYLAEAERAQGLGRWRRRLETLAGEPSAAAWAWEIQRSRDERRET